MLSKLIDLFLYKKNMLTESMGFDNLADLLTSSLYINVIKDKASIPVLAISLTSIITLVSEYIDKSIFSPALGIWLLFLFTGADIVAGVSISISEKKPESKESKFDPNRLTRSVFKFVFQLFIIFSLFQMSKVWDEWVSKWMVDGIVLMFCIATLWSAIKNARKLNWIDQNVYEILEAILSVDRIFKKLKEKIGINNENPTQDPN